MGAVYLGVALVPSVTCGHNPGLPLNYSLRTYSRVSS